MVTLTYFVHGTTTDNEESLATGWLPGELSELGRKQSKELGELITDQMFDAIFCSDLHRAIESADLMFGNTREIIQDKRLREANYGDLNGGSKKIKDSMMVGCIDQPFPNGESYLDAEARLSSFCKFLKENFDGKHVAAVAHEAPQLALDVILKGKTWPQAIAEDWRKTKSYQPGWEYTIA
jgi:broad specificity phosphatase PhoE